ncbi:MAG TPA: hypothetical protein VFZ25_13595 [Chloroflexota bacterium]|nr:hypothetical protein [Chloroflexota bacterium]
MNCSVCGFNNGDFTVRCQNCGELLVAPPESPPPPEPRTRALLYLLAASTAILGLGLMGLIVLISHQGLWDQLTATVAAEPTFGGIHPTPVRQEPMVPASPTTLPKPMRPAALTVGQIGTSDEWRFAVEQVRYAPDDAANGSNQLRVTFVLQNQGPQLATLNVPSTAHDTAAGPPAAAPTPGFVPDAGVHDVSPATVDGLRLFAVDSAMHEYGGGFGTNLADFQMNTPPGDVLRLTYFFRFPANQPQPAVLRAMFPLSAGGKTFDVHLDQPSGSSVDLQNQELPSDVPADTWATVANEWSISLEGIDFGPPPTQGEQTITVHLNVQNLSAAPRPALTDVDDLQGTLRDFYLVDAAGHIAYSQDATLPSIVVPGHGQRDVAIHLATTEISSTARPLHFVTVINSHANRYVRFILR